MGQREPAIRIYGSGMEAQILKTETGIQGLPSACHGSAWHISVVGF